MPDVAFTEQSDGRTEVQSLQRVVRSQVPQTAVHSETHTSESLATLGSSRAPEWPLGQYLNATVDKEPGLELLAPGVDEYSKLAYSLPSI